MALLIGAHASANNRHSIDPVASQALNNLSSGFVECAAYFEIVSIAAERSNDRNTAVGYSRLGDTALRRAVMTARMSRTVTLPMKVTLARYEMALKDMLSEIDHNVSNISILINDYSTQCEHLMEHPERVMKDWVIKLMKKE